MALPAVRSGKPRHLEAVGAEDGNGVGKLSLADRLAAAQAAVAGPQRRVSELEATLTAAVEKGDYASAAVTQAELRPAREALALAEVDVRVIGEALAALDAAAGAELRQVEEAQRRELAQAALAVAGEKERAAQAEIDGALAGVWDHIRAAQDDYRRALAAQDAIRQARQAEAQARGVLEPLPPGHHYPVPSGENRVGVLADNDPLIRELARWRP